jgi:hypothetical protein
MGAKAYQKSKIKKQNHNPKIKKAQQPVILSETKNLDCDTVSSVLWPDPSAAPQDDSKNRPIWPESVERWRGKFR